MKAKDYIFQRLELLAKKFPGVSFDYEYHLMSDTHFVHVRPLEIYDNDEDYQLAEVNVVDDFLSLYPMESIAFVSDNSLITVSKPERVFTAHNEQIIVENQFASRCYSYPEGEPSFYSEMGAYFALAA